jgi:two-component system sensor histidine kinase BaeS
VPARWYRSLYWRIAVGFVLCLAAVLVVQALLLILVASRSGPTLPGVPPDRFARAVAQDLSAALELDANVNIQDFLRDQYGREAHPLFVLLADGREFNNGGGPAPDALLQAARERLRSGSLERRGPVPQSNEAGGPRSPLRRPRIDGADRPGLSGRLERPGFGGGMGPGPAFRGGRPAPITVDGRLFGVVIVPPRAPFGFLLARYAPTLAVVAVGSLVVGAVLATVLIFGPARRRLRALEDAARRLGRGDLTARAPAQGGDEVAAVAAAFNTMADDLAARADALAASDHLRRQLLADVSHELTTPVTAMRGYLETLTMPEFRIDDETRARYLGIVADETGRLERIIGDLLDLARLEGGGGSLNVERVPVAQVFERVAARHERTAAAAGVAITTAIEAGAETVQGDRDRLEQALQNLAANALRYAPRGTAVELTARRTGAGVVLGVTDHGPGVAPEHLPHLFERFYKAEASRASQPEGSPASHGSGLGLSIVKAIAQRHGGTVGVRSEPGRTVFEITLPA